MRNKSSVRIIKLIINTSTLMSFTKLCKALLIILHTLTYSQAVLNCIVSQKGDMDSDWLLIMNMSLPGSIV